MRLFGIGIDVVEVERIEGSIAEFGEQFLERIFTENERAYCERQRNPALHFAARFAAKEAVSKAFGTGIGESVGWRDLEVVRKESGEPELRLYGRGKEYAEERGVAEVKISLTHARHYAAANAVVMVAD
ncbi:MAG: holo-ACP synthase [Verrucomicrobiota bacterium]